MEEIPMAASECNEYGNYSLSECKGCPLTIECVLVNILCTLKDDNNKKERKYFKGITRIINKEALEAQENARSKYFDKRIKENYLYIQELELEKNNTAEVKNLVEIEEEILRLKDEINKYEKMKQENYEL